MRASAQPPDTGYGLHAAEFGHGNIQQDEIGPERLRGRMPASPSPPRPRPSGRARCRAKGCFRPLQEQGVIFDYQYRGHVVSPCADALRQDAPVPKCHGF